MDEGGYDGDVEESVLEEYVDAYHRLLAEDPLEARSWGGDEGWLEEVNVSHDDEKAPFVGVVVSPPFVGVVVSPPFVGVPSSPPFSPPI